MQSPKRDHRKHLVIKDSVLARCSADAVMERILRPATWPEWQSEIIEVEGPTSVGEGDVVRGRASMMGFDVDGQSVAAEVDEGVFYEQVVVGVGMQIRYEVVATDRGTEITHTLTSRLPRGALGRILSFFLARRLKRMQKTLLVALARQAEAS